MPPRFQFTLSSPSNPKNGQITLGDEIVHRINDYLEFYRELGYTDEVIKSGLLPEEFVWLTYHKDMSEKSEICLQVKIIKYLSKYSANFKEKYAVQCEHWLAKCKEKLLSNSTECKDCGAT